MVADDQFYKKQYSEYHGDGLVDCSGAQWPLALTKQTEWSTVTLEQSAYNYPLIRYPQNKGSSTYATEYTSYYFRFNETQRFYFEVGSNFIDGLAVLRLSATQKSSNWAIKGKQIGNINIIDTYFAILHIGSIQVHSMDSKSGNLKYKQTFTLD